MRVPFQFLLAAILAAVLTGCGFQLRGTLSGNLPYKTMMIALPDTSEVRVWLERYINAAGTTEIIDDPKLADATFQQLSDSRKNGGLILRRKLLDDRLPRLIHLTDQPKQ